MRDIIIIAWRNLWRNKRRTLITISSIFFALFYAIIMRSFQMGTYNRMLDNTVTQFTGQLEIQDKEYFDNPVIDYSFAYTDSIEKILKSNKKITAFFPTIRTGALASSGADSKVAVISGIDFDKEAKYKGLDKAVAKFFLDSSNLLQIENVIDKNNAKVLMKYKQKFYNSKNRLRQDLYADGYDTTKYFDLLCEKTALPKVDLYNMNNGVLVGYLLAKYLNLNIGDSLILFGQGFRGNTAVGKYIIRGFLNFPIDNLNRMAIYMPLKTAQIFLSAYDIDNKQDTSYYVNYIAVNTIYQVSMRDKDYSRILSVKNNIESKLNNKSLTVVGWHRLNKRLVQTIQMGNVKTAIFTGIFYLIIAFGILGTIMMMIAERKREFGIMMALGMKRRILSLIVSLEMIFMGLIASVAGILVSAPFIWLGHKFPIKMHGAMAVQFQKMNMQPVIIFQNFGSYIFAQVEIVFLIVLIVLIYAILKINKLKVISSLRT